MENKSKERSEKGISDQAEIKFIDLSVIKSLECNYMMSGFYVTSKCT